MQLKAKGPKYTYQDPIVWWMLSREKDLKYSCLDLIVWWMLSKAKGLSYMAHQTALTSQSGPGYLWFAIFYIPYF